MKKQILFAAALTAAILTLPNNTPVYAASGFTDVGRTYKKAIEWAVDPDQNGNTADAITRGTSSTAFSPDLPVTRAQVMTFLYRYSGSPDISPTRAFSDLPTNSDFIRAISWGVENRITEGFSDGTFRPNKPCSRAEILTFLYRLQNSPRTEITTLFSDLTGNQTYDQAISWGVHNRITAGTGNHKFQPSVSATRAQAISFLYRMSHPSHDDFSDSADVDSHQSGETPISQDPSDSTNASDTSGRPDAPDASDSSDSSGTADNQTSGSTGDQNNTDSRDYYTDTITVTVPSYEIEYYVTNYGISTNWLASLEWSCSSDASNNYETQYKQARLFRFAWPRVSDSSVANIYSTYRDSQFAGWSSSALNALLVRDYDAQRLPNTLNMNGYWIDANNNPILDHSGNYINRTYNSGNRGTLSDIPLDIRTERVRAYLNTHPNASAEIMAAVNSSYGGSVEAWVKDQNFTLMNASSAEGVFETVNTHTAVFEVIRGKQNKEIRTVVRRIS